MPVPMHGSLTCCSNWQRRRAVLPSRFAAGRKAGLTCADASSPVMIIILCTLILAASLLLTAAAHLPAREPGSAAVRSPYAPTNGWTYAVEAIRSSPWPSCPYRFLSFPDSCDSVDLWRGAGPNQYWTLESASSSDPSAFYLRASCGSYLRCSLMRKRFLYRLTCICNLQLPF
jgi:hypothetical protein